MDKHYPNGICKILPRYDKQRINRNGCGLKKTGDHLIPNKMLDIMNHPFGVFYLRLSNKAIHTCPSPQIKHSKKESKYTCCCGSITCRFWERIEVFVVESYNCNPKNHRK